ncbi:peptidoglycan-binding domain-containing protein [Streptomyces sp. NPDC093544]|uniref:peptidoglycan-binding domain-containing protein n=1 Tax=Streptomyces sp. NPDC093544 TaxID=3155200 RepID=UPI003446EDFA
MSTRSVRRRRGTILTVVLVAAVAASVAAAALGFGGSSPAGTDKAADTPGKTATITRRTLVDETTVAGRLGYGAATSVESRATGTLTWLPAVGKTIGRGGVLLRADNKPVVLLYGALPMYRTLTAAVPAPPPTPPEPETGSGTEGTGTAPSEATQPEPAVGTPATNGPDVEQFERNLRELGYEGFTVDQEFTDLTAKAVKRWQKDLGLPRTGKVGIDQVVYAAGPVRIASHSAKVGASATGEMLTRTATTKVVTVDVRAADTAWAVKGTKVTVALPGGKTVAGTVFSVGTDATAAQASGEGGQGDDPATGTDTATVPVTVTVARQSALGSLETTPVDVRHTVETRKDVLAVPVAALLALAEGGYGLETVAGTHTAIVAVRTGLFADGWVEVSGSGISAGQRVGIPG